MRNDKIIASWNKIEPSNFTNERMLSAILERNRSVHDGRNKVNYMSKAKKMMIPVTVCLVLLAAVFGIAGTNLNWFGTKNVAGIGVDGTIVSVGSLPEGIDPVMASIAVYPADRNLSDVENATLNEITESEAYSTIELGKHLPTYIPYGYHFKHARINETTMKDGTKYYLLRVNFIAGDKDNTDIPNLAPKFFIQLMNYKPDTKRTIYTIDTLPKDLSGKGFLHVAYDNLYIGFDVGNLTYDEIMLVLNSIK